MIVDLLIIAIVCGSAALGYRTGFMSTLFKTLGYIAGGVLGIYLSLNYTHAWGLDFKRVGLIIAAIAVGGFIGSFAGQAVARGFRATLIRGPLGFLDNVLGAALEIVRSVVVIYLIASVLIWAPWQTGKDAISESKIYPKIETRLPGFITQIKSQIQSEFSNLHL